MVVSVLAPQGGIEAALVPLSQELKARGHDVSIYVLQPPPRPNQYVDALERAGIPILTAPVLDDRVARWVGERRLRIAAGLSAAMLPAALLPALAVALWRRCSPLVPLQGARLRMLGWFARWPSLEGLPYRGLLGHFRRLRPDLVHVHGWGCGEDPPGALSWLRRYGCALVYTEHASPDPRLVPRIPEAPVNLADVLIAVSRAGQAGLESVGGARRPIRVIPYSVEPITASTRPVRRDGEFVVTCVARLSPQKRHTDLIDALGRVCSVVPGARLVLAGDGPLRGELEARSRRLGLEAHVSFLGPVTRSELPGLFARTDVVALASLWEGLPVALIEALSAGLPIVASDAGGNPELVHHGENGLIVPAGDVEALAGALLQLADDPARRQRMGAASADRFRRGEFERASVVEQHLEVYRLAVELQRKGGWPESDGPAEC